QCMESVLSEFAGKPEHKSSDSIFFVLMSHRILHGISGTLHSDDSPDVLQYDTIFKIFNNCSCPGLRDKPKVIIVQTCRSVVFSTGEVWVKYSEAAPKDSLAQSSENLESDAIHKIHVEKDFIIFYTTTPHRYNIFWRDSTEGSYFIKQLMAGFQKYNSACNVFQLYLMGLSRVHLSCEKPNGIVQMPTFGRLTVGRLCYLSTGH
uniref:Caspase family p20 domain-containing protein n=1 Tax=Cavia porcellus TaxID=10141 RepID=H0VET0_CAVPO